MLWLLRTSSIEEIILNASALGFVMELGEAIFANMITEPVKSVLLWMEPLLCVALPAVPIQSAKMRTSAHGPCLVWVVLVTMLAVILPVISSNVVTMTGTRTS